MIKLELNSLDVITCYQQNYCSPKEETAGGGGRGGVGLSRTEVVLHQVWVQEQLLVEGVLLAQEKYRQQGECEDCEHLRPSM